MLSKSVLVLVASALVSARPNAPNAQPYANTLKTRQASYNDSSLEVDLGYAVYKGFTNASANLNEFYGIRYAQAPIGSLRWQLPRPPLTNRSSVIDATSYAPTCPQSASAGIGYNMPNNTGTSEDCLFINVQAPNNASGPLPVLVSIHGGGYGEGSGRQDLTPLITTNDNAFIGVTIQYRLGAFGFLSSDEVYQKGSVNAGLYDQYLSLQWVQQYIHLFGGDPRQVTIEGESAGGGSSMLLSMAYGGTIGTQLFQNSIGASPYLPMQYGYKDWVPSQAYYAFATAAGCPPTTAVLHNGSTPIFQCLVAKDSETLIEASNNISQSGSYGGWAFLPVTDGHLVQDLPSRQLLRGNVNGVNGLWGNNADEGFFFVDQDIKTEDDLVAYLQVTFPMFSEDDIAKTLYYYPSSNATDNPKAPLFATEGDSGPTAVNQSSTATGQQERANLIYSETTFVCPSYWLAEAYAKNPLGGHGYKYQFSIPPSTHGADTPGYYSYPGQVYSVDFDTAFSKAYGNFIRTGNPSISNSIADGLSTKNSSANPASNWPAFSLYNPYQIDLNTTCPDPAGNGFVSCSSVGMANEIRQVNAYTFEGGRGTRCDFWRSMGELVPE